MPSSSTITRRALLTLAATSVLASQSRVHAQAARKPRILLRSSWQTVNIGDIAHTPGVLRLLEEHIPDAEVRLWPSSVDNGVEPILRKRFPNVSIVKGEAAIRTAMKECDFLLHGSGPSLVAETSVIQWQKETSKPFGVYGVTLSNISDRTLGVLSSAKFVFCRDSVSLQHLKDRGCTSPVMDFAPDGAFAVDLRNDTAADEFLNQHGLEAGKFLCCIPRLRKTPYWKIRNKAMTEVDHTSQARNEAMKEHDHAQLRAAIIQVTEQTPLKVLLCPEDQSQMAVGKEMLFDPLPASVKKKVVWRENYWLTDEALSTYVRSAGLFGNEMHSPIMCVGNGVPAIVCRFAEQTSKGFMWRDIGLSDWLFDLDQESDLPKIAPAVLQMAQDPDAARAKAARAREFVLTRQRESMAIVKRETLAAAATAS